jgi:hypothetical protein
MKKKEESDHGGNAQGVERSGNFGAEIPCDWTFVSFVAMVSFVTFGSVSEPS